MEQCKSQVVFNVLSSVYELTKMTAVQPSHPSDSTESSRTRWVRDNGNFTFQPFEVEKEIQAHTVNSKERNDIFHNIIRNISSGKKSKKHILIGFMGVFGSLLSTCFYTMIPVHDIIQNQHYWYEFPTQLFFGLLPNWVAMILFRCKYYMNINEMKRLPQNYMFLCFLTQQHKTMCFLTTCTHTYTLTKTHAFSKPICHANPLAGARAVAV